MIIVVLGASGGVGRELIGQAFDQNHQVRAVLRDRSRSPWLPGAVEATELDLADPTTDRLATLTRVLSGADVLLSALGARTKSDQGVLGVAARVAVDAMAQAGVKRYLGVSAAPVGTVASPSRPHPPKYDPGDDALSRYLLTPLVRRVFGAGYADAAVMEDTIRTSRLDWTLVRPPRLTNRVRSDDYRLAVDQNVHGGRQVGRADVAAVMLRSIPDRTTIGHTLGVAD